MTKKLLVFFLALFSIVVHGQDEISDIIDDYKAKLDSVDKKSIKTKYLLNKGFLIEDPIVEFLDFKGSGEDGFKLTDRRTFKRIYRMLRKSDLKKNKRLPKYDFKELKRTTKERTDYVPIGVVQARGEYLDMEEIDNNISLTQQGVPIADEYTKYHIFNASVLKKKVYSGEVTFEALPELFHIQNENKVKSLSINFDDGQGWKPLAKGDVHQVQYGTRGVKSIAIKFGLANREFISYSAIKIVQLEQEEPTMVFELSADENGSASKAIILRGKAAINRSTSSTGLSGGTAFMYVGCDGVFDRPVIIVEGFDALNDESIADVREKYRSFTDIEEILRSNGRDVIYLNFQSGGADIRTNGNVLRNLMESVNREKQGNQPSVVIGESMGGLVARWALRRMEMGGRTHNVSHYISFDAPHRGANVPVGYQKLLEDVDRIAIRDLFGIGQGEIDDAFDLLDSKAAKQMLLRHRGANPHPDFTTWQNELNSIGFPSQGGLQNIAIVNGALNGSTAGNGDLDYSPGSRILEYEWGSVITSGRIRVRTNPISGTGRVSSIWIFTGPVPTTIRERSLSFNQFNYDIAAGGYQDNQGASDVSVPALVQILFRFYFNASGNDNFSFVPLFSGLASTAPLNNQNDLNRSEAQLTGNNWTPFDEVYGDVNDNSPHIRTDFLREQWEDLLRDELGLQIRTTCGVATGNGTPTTPRINTNYWYSCQNSGATRTIRVDNNPAINNLYEHSWTVTGPQSFGGSGNTLTMSSTMRPGVYRITCTRRFRSGQGLNGTATRTTSRLFTLFGERDRRCSGGSGGFGGPGPGGGIPLTAEIGQDAEPVEDVVIWPNPVANTFQVGYHIPEDGKVSVTLTSMFNGAQSITFVDSKTRAKGNHYEQFDTGSLTNGIYILTVEINGKRVTRKVILQRQ